MIRGSPGWRKRVPARGWLMLALGVSGCATTWRTQKGPTAEVLRLGGAEDYLVTPITGDAVILHDPVVVGDSIIGTEKPDPTGPDTPARRAIALSNVKALAVKEPDGVANTFWAVLASIGAAIAMLAIACHSDCFE